jgi:hypothetical protein
MQRTSKTPRQDSWAGFDALQRFHDYRTPKPQQQSGIFLKKMPPASNPARAHKLWNRSKCRQTDSKPIRLQSQFGMKILWTKRTVKSPASTKAAFVFQ